MAIDPQHPGDVGGNFALELPEGLGKLVHFDEPGRIDVGRALGEQHFRLEDEAVADHQDVGALAEDLAQAPEEFRAVARQLLDALRQRRIEPLAEIDDLRLVGAATRLRHRTGGR